MLLQGPNGFRNPFGLYFFQWTDYGEQNKQNQYKDENGLHRWDLPRHMRAGEQLCNQESLQGNPQQHPGNATGHPIGSCFRKNHFMKLFVRHTDCAHHTDIPRFGGHARLHGIDNV